MRTKSSVAMWATVCVLVTAAASTSATAQQLPPTRGSSSGGFDLSGQMGPSVSFATLKLDFGTIPDITRVGKKIVFRNVGNDLLTITNVKSGCGCTVAELKIRDYMPGEEGVLEVFYDPTGRTGRQHKTIEITTNDPANPRITIDVNALIRPVVKFTPRGVNLRQVVRGKGASGTILVTSDRERFEITGVRVEGGALDYEIGEPEIAKKPDGTTYHKVTLTVKVAPGAPMGWFSRRLVVLSLVSDDSGKMVAHEATATMTANVVGDIETRPQRLQFGMPNPGEKYSKKIRVLSRTGRPFKVLGTEIKIQDKTLPISPEISFESSVMVGTGEKVTIISLTGVFPDEPGLIRGMFVIKTDHPDQPEVSIPFFGSVRQARR